MAQIYEIMYKTSLCFKNQETEGLFKYALFGKVIHRTAYTRYYTVVYNKLQRFLQHFYRFFSRKGVKTMRKYTLSTKYTELHDTFFYYVPKLSTRKTSFAQTYAQYDGSSYGWGWQ